MANVSVRPSSFAVKAETTEGTLNLPTASSDFVALQDDLSLTPAFDTLENAELKSSLGASAPIQGAENPTASFSHYLRHSGTEGSAPNYGMILKTAFGNEDDAGVEHNTIAASTTTVVKVDTGEGATYLRGQGLLVKHASNAYEIRCVDSVSSDDLTVSFALNNAPGTGVDLGEAITYYPANSGHQTVSLAHYLGNSGAIQAIAGARVDNATFTFPAGQLINANYSFAGLEYFFNPIEITATDTKLDFTDDGGTFAATITAQVYKDPHELASALQTAMNAVASETMTVTYSDTDGKYDITNTSGSTLSLLWNTGANAANTVGDKIGFSTAANDTGATTYEGDNAITLSTPATPSFDSSDPLSAKANELFIGDQADNACVSANNVEVSIDLPTQLIDDICADSGRSGSIVGSRAVTISVTGAYSQYDVDKFKRFRANDTTRFQYNFGTKSGGNWVAGKCGALYAPNCKISEFEVVPNGDIFDVSMTLTAFVGTGNSLSNDEIFLTFL